MARPGSFGTAKEKAVIGQIAGGRLSCKALKFEGLSNMFSLARDYILPTVDVTADQDFRIIDTRLEQAAIHNDNCLGPDHRDAGYLHVYNPGFANAIPEAPIGSPISSSRAEPRKYSNPYAGASMLREFPKRRNVKLTVSNQSRLEQTAFTHDIYKDTGSCRTRGKPREVLGSFK
jgi:hypothetical protein